MLPDEIRKTMGAFKFYSLLIVALGVVAYVAFTYGNEHYGSQQKMISTMQQTMDNLSSENQRLTSQLNILGVELEVQRLAAQKSQAVIQQGLDREAQLKQEISFYQRVMAPELTQEGFSIEAFDLTKSLSDNAFRFELVLMQHDKIKNMVKGDVEVLIRGSENGTPSSYKLRDLLTGEQTQLAFGFKYFQTISGELILPEGFTPEKVTVRAEVFQFKRKRGDLSKTFDWQVNSYSPAEQ